MSCLYKLESKINSLICFVPFLLILLLQSFIYFLPYHLFMVHFCVRDAVGILLDLCAISFFLLFFDNKLRYNWDVNYNA